MTHSRYHLNTIPSTRAQFAKRLAYIGACNSAVSETQGKTLREAWEQTENFGYLSFWLRMLGTGRTWQRRLDVLQARAFELFHAGKFTSAADAFRSLISFDGHRPGYRLAQLRMGRRARNARKRK